MKQQFYEVRDRLSRQFEAVRWLPESGEEYETLKRSCDALERRLEAEGASRPISKASVFAYVLRHGQLALDENDLFSDKLNGRGILSAQKNRWHSEVLTAHFRTEEPIRKAARETGAWLADADFGHTSPNSKALLSLGFSGLEARIEAARQKNAPLSPAQRDFYDSCTIVQEAVRDFLRRYAAVLQETHPHRAATLAHLAEGAPRSFYEALQLLWIYFYIHEYIGGTRVRTLGRLDALLTPFYLADIKGGTATKEDIREQLRYFLNKIWAAKVAFDLPFLLGGTDENGEEVTNELSVLIVETYRELDIHSPKLHIRISGKTPEAFVKLVLRCIREGCSSFLLVNDPVAIRTLEKAGLSREDARDYVLIGCYEPAANGKEIGCTGNGSVNLAKAVEFVFTGGKDFKTGVQLGLPTPEPESFEAFLTALKAQISSMAKWAMDYVRKIEPFYPCINPDPILSAQYDACVEQGVDAYSGGAKYNNSSLNFSSIATVTDSLMAVKTLVYDEKQVSFHQMGQLLLQNWEGNEALRLCAKHLPAKYGNGAEETDRLAADLAVYAAGLVNGKPNGRGGVFKAGLYSIDHCFTEGAVTMATPDGRRFGEPLSKNLSAVTAMDKEGITALIRSVTAIDHTDFPNGSVLDVVFHPTAVAGEHGLAAFYGLLKAYFASGGFALHGNVFDSAVLKEAQQNPEQYATLQVRLCGWNAYFTNLTKLQQDDFIRQTEGKNA